MTYLKLSGCSLGSLGADSFARTVLADHKGLVVLDLSRNKLGVAGAKYITEALAGNTTLRRLDLSYNDIGIEGAIAIAAFLPDCFGLKELCLDGNGLELAGSLKVSILSSWSDAFQLFFLSFFVPIL